jgi:hypothetical protein
MPESHLRAADADRAAVASVLGRHMSAGRLTLDEYDERLARAYAAKTYGDLAELTSDLPADRPPAASPASRDGAPRAAGCGARASGGNGQPSWRAWSTTALIVSAVWLATVIASGQLTSFWPVWVIGPWAAVLLAQTLGGGRNRGRDRRRQLDS